MSSKYLLVFCIIKCIICLSSVYGQQGFQYEPYYPYNPQQPYPPYQPYNEVDDDLRGDYCNRRGPLKCCPQRDDTCSVPILGTLCYCDLFCNRTTSGDCCPDFEEVCLGRRVQPPEQIVRPHAICFNYRRTGGCCPFFYDITLLRGEDGDLAGHEVFHLSIFTSALWTFSFSVAGRRLGVQSPTCQRLVEFSETGW
ncbi:hypothetical protein AVEN_147692-1 [Araneus ventricosus]|uniref:SMB domain-containing protein n=1 Tax=Araneus ventricosus TaxID=182803 RepID=A0A4Y2MCU1_ARAVE|nr:hypothetical protein AVEN_147692-1 [Araneus ventricosus]